MHSVRCQLCINKAGMSKNLKAQLFHPRLLPSNIPHPVNGLLLPPTLRLPFLLQYQHLTHQQVVCCPLQIRLLHHPCSHRVNTSQTPQPFPTTLGLNTKSTPYPPQATLPVPSGPAGMFCFFSSFLLYLHLANSSEAFRCHFKCHFPRGCPGL